jgi:hypothetical protein
MKYRVVSFVTPSPAQSNLNTTDDYEKQEQEIYKEIEEINQAYSRIK